MDILYAIFRVVHIFAGVFWAGTALFFVGYLTPTVEATGQEGMKVMQQLVARTRLIAVTIAAAALSVLSGIFMFLTRSWFALLTAGTATGVTLTVGAVAGLLAAILGIGVIGPVNLRMASLIREIQDGGGPPSESQAAELGRLSARGQKWAVYVPYLLVIAVVGMALNEAM
jgi:uncharacterized membrane protein